VNVETQKQKKAITPIILLVVIYLAFIGLGLPDGIFGIAWPGIHTAFKLPLQTAGYINVIIMCCCALTCFTVKYAIDRFGTGLVTMISCLVTGFSLLGFALSSSVIWLVLLAIPLGLGKGAIDTGLNYYVSNNYSSRFMSWLHCCWGGGATLGTLIMTGAIAQTAGWRLGYREIAVLQLTIAAVLLLSLGLWKGMKRVSREDSGVHFLKDVSVLKSYAPWFAILLFFLNTGIVSTISLWANSMLVISRNIPKTTAGLWLSLFFGAITGGRFLSGIIVYRLGNRNVIRYSLIISLVGTFMLLFRDSPNVNMTGLILIGLGLAPLFPCMIHETPRRFDKKTAEVLIGCQVGAAYLGGSALPAALGIVVSYTTLELLVPCIIVLVIVMLILTEKLYSVE
jgi:fucose permease